MESALRIVSHWALGTALELTDRPCNIFIDNPTEQAYEIKSYIDIHKGVLVYLEHLEFEELLEGLMKDPL
tara:strand:+ start:39 stop:248 length:210 start_codon:yes stop_codon:yes gene_type:complete